MCFGSAGYTDLQWQRCQKMFSTACGIAPPVRPAAQGSGNRPAQCGTGPRCIKAAPHACGHTGKRIRWRSGCKSNPSERGAPGFWAQSQRLICRRSRRSAQSPGAFPARRINGGRPYIAGSRPHQRCGAKTAGHRHRAFGQNGTDRLPCRPCRCERPGKAGAPPGQSGFRCCAGYVRCA